MCILLQSYSIQFLSKVYIIKSKGDFFFFLYRAACAAYGGSQVRSQTRVTAANLATATARWDLNCICKSHHSSQQCWIPNPLSKARDQSCIFMDTVGLVTTEPQHELPKGLFEHYEVYIIYILSQNILFKLIATQLGIHL